MKVTHVVGLINEDQSKADLVVLVKTAAGWDRAVLLAERASGLKAVKQPNIVLEDNV